MTRVDVQYSVEEEKWLVIGHTGGYKRVVAKRIQREDAVNQAKEITEKRLSKDFRDYSSTDSAEVHIYDKSGKVESVKEVEI